MRHRFCLAERVIRKHLTGIRLVQNLDRRNTMTVSQHDLSRPFDVEIDVAIGAVLIQRIVDVLEAPGRIAVADQAVAEDSQERSTRNVARPR
ncbi:MAG: hypothetical protein R2849_03720 [Thermomicrobiales bacterium]